VTQRVALRLLVEPCLHVQLLCVNGEAGQTPNQRASAADLLAGRWRLLAHSYMILLSLMGMKQSTTAKLL
jgi:hypothetical protein